MFSYVYIQTSQRPPLYTVGFYKPTDRDCTEAVEFVAESDHVVPEDAADRVRWLNGGAVDDSEPDRYTCPVGLALSSDLRPLVVCEDGSVWTGPPGRFLEVSWDECAPIPDTERACELARASERETARLEAAELEATELVAGELLAGEIEAEVELEDEEPEDPEAGYPGGEI